jgi:hypothetical protein
VTVPVQVRAQERQVHVVIEVEAEQVVGLTQVDGIRDAELLPPSGDAVFPLPERGTGGRQAGSGQVPASR